MSPRTFTWQSDDQEHTATLDGSSLRWATVTDAYDDDHPYTGATEQEQAVADFLAGGPAERAPVQVLEQILAALGTPGGRTPWLEPLRLQQAATAGDVAAIQALLRAGPQPPRAALNTVVRGRTALSAAIEAEHIEAATALVAARCDPNVRLDGGATALHVAAHGAKTAVWVGLLRALLAAGADLEARGDEGQTPLLHGLRGHLCKEGVETLVAGHKAVNTPSADGTTPLLAEARGWCRPSVVRALIGAGADINARSKDGWSALLWAITKHDVWFVKMLVDGGADVKVIGQPHKQGQSARSALELARSFTAPAGASSKDRALPLAKQIVDLLLAAGAGK
jgi:Ankyrin repeats (3 copies)/Ankyrin repeats (many copies)